MGWEDLVLERHPRLDPYRCMEDVRAALNEGALKRLSLIFKEEPDYVVQQLASDLLALRAWGFERIANTGLELLKGDVVLGAGMLECFGLYTIYGVETGLCGLRPFDDLVDGRVMAFLGLRPAELLPSPALLSLATQRPVGCSAVVRPDRDDVRAFLKRGPDDELARCLGGFQRAAWDYDLLGIVKHCERLGEIISERYDKELEDWFRRSKVARGTIRGGIILTSSMLSLSSIPPELKTLLEILLGILERCHERLSDWLVERWPLAEKGLPFFLWKYGIEPKGRARGPPPRTSLDEWMASLPRLDESRQEGRAGGLRSP